MQELDADRVTVAPLSGATVGYVCPTAVGLYFLVNDWIPTERVACAVRHLGSHVEDAAACDDVAAWCEAPACPWACLAFGELQRCASGTA